MENRVLIVIGHTIGADKGAYSETLKSTEFEYNKKVADLICNADIYTHKQQDYANRIKDLNTFLKSKNYKLVIELHFNSFSSSSANGYEILCYAGSNKGEYYAKELVKMFEKEYPNQTKRASNGILFVEKRSERGGGFLMGINPPAILVEPFFGSNEKEAIVFSDIKRYACMLNNFVNKINNHDI